MVVARAQGMAGLVGVLATYISTLSSMPATLLNPAMQSSCFNMSQRSINNFGIYHSKNQLFRLWPFIGRTILNFELQN